MIYLGVYGSIVGGGAVLLLVLMMVVKLKQRGEKC